MSRSAFPLLVRVHIVPFPAHESPFRSNESPCRSAERISHTGQQVNTAGLLTPIARPTRTSRMPIVIPRRNALHLAALSSSTSGNLLPWRVPDSDSPLLRLTYYYVVRIITLNVLLRRT